MKTTDFLKEDIVSDAAEMHQDHEVQMARKDCYTAADDAIALHKLLRNISEAQGLEGWVAAKITLAADYLGTVREHLEYKMMSNQESTQDVTLSIAEEGVAEGEVNTDRMNQQHQEFYNQNPHFKRNNREIKSVGNKLATKVEPSTKPAQVKRKPATSFSMGESSGTSSGSVATSMAGGNGFANGGPGTVKRITTKKVKK